MNALTPRELGHFQLTQKIRRQFNAATTDAEKVAVLKKWNAVVGSDPNQLVIHRLPSEQFRLN